MKIVNIIGGLGNQMFQYAFALYLKHKFPNEDVYYDASHFRHIFIKKWGVSNLHNGFELTTLFSNLTLKQASWKKIMSVSYFIPNYFLSRVARRLLPKRKSEYIPSLATTYQYDPRVKEISGDCYFEGYWQSITYYLPIQQKIAEEFNPGEPSPQNLRCIEEMEKSQSVGIHIRRGDYLKSPSFGGVCELDYYKRSLDYLLEDGVKRTFFIFTNDEDWCAQNIYPLLEGHKIVFVRHNKGQQSYWDMFLMSKCKQLIIANSSFSWWGAFLNTKAKKILAPYPWTRHGSDHDIYAPSWIKIKSC